MSFTLLLHKCRVNKVAIYFVQVAISSWPCNIKLCLWASATNLVTGGCLAKLQVNIRIYIYHEICDYLIKDVARDVYL